MDLAVSLAAEGCYRNSGQRCTAVKRLLVHETVLETFRKAAVERDIEQMYTAGEVIYPPCEECHLQFHPGVEGQ